MRLCFYQLLQEGVKESGPYKLPRRGGLTAKRSTNAPDTMKIRITKKQFDRWQEGPMQIIFPALENEFVIILTHYLWAI